MRTALRTLALRLALAVACVAIAAVLSSQPSPREQVGPLPGGSFLLNSGWKLDPVGKQVPLDTLPISSAMTQDGKYLLVLNAGYRPPSVSVIDIATGTVIGSQKLQDAWLGLAMGPSRDRVYVGGGSTASVFELAFTDGKLQPARTFPVVDAARRTPQDFIADVAFSPDGRLLYASDLYHDSVVVINPQSGMVINRFKTGRRPYRIVFAPDGKSFFVTHWADGTMGHYDTATGSQLASVRIGSHPTDIVWQNGGPPDAAPPEAGEQPALAARIFVAAANTNNVYVVGVSPSKELSVIESINLAMTPRQPVGMTPSGLAVSPDGKRLFVACSDGNVAGVVDISTERSHVEGFIPTGWYPTAVRLLPSGTLVVLNGKGLRSYANPADGPNPSKRPTGEHQEPGIRPGYVGYMQTGTASWIEPFTAEQLEAWTKKAMANSPYRDSKLDETYSVPPIEHVLYIVRENRTYDQVLGDVGKGNSDPSLVLFGAEVTPNLHKLAREFVLLDNFYVNADVSADGHNWSTAAIAPDYVQKLWPNQYAGRRKNYDFEEQDPASLAPAGYIWTGAAASGVTIRNYGNTTTNTREIADAGHDQVTAVRDPVLAKSTNRLYRGFDLKYPDVERAKVFLADLAAWEKAGQMPRLMVMRLGNDHTSGTAAGAVAPLSAAADNDLAVGRIVEGISKSRFWASTVICILEDDAQNGPDHVDSHRSPAFLISPFVKRHTVDSTMYNTASMLRTIEVILGLRPMTQFDAAARPMFAAFQPQPDNTPYAIEQPRQPLDAKNPATPAAAASNRMDFDEADRNDDDELNDILWRAIRKDAPPVPVRSYFSHE
jgi:YVTN family beta-propeller protein